MSNNNNNNNGNRNGNNNRPENEIKKMHQKDGSCNDSSCKDGSMKKGASQEQGKPMQQGKPAQGSQQKPTSGNNEIKKYSYQEVNEDVESSDEVESNKKNEGW